MHTFIHAETGAARPRIPLTDVTSSQVKSVGYDPESQTLAVAFTRGAGAIYHYPEVTPEQHAEFINAESIGAYFGKHIKQRTFDKYVPTGGADGVT